MLLDDTTIKALFFAIFAIISYFGLKKGESYKELIHDEDEIPNHEDLCGICLDRCDMEVNPFMTRCGHWFHKEGCFDQLERKYERYRTSSNYECPFCRERVTKDQDTEFERFFAEELSEGNFEKIKKKTLIKFLQYLISIKAETHHITQVIDMLKKKKDWKIDERFGMDGKTMLMFAARVGNAKAIEKLCKSGADMNAKCYSGFNALYYAIVNGHDTAAEELLNNGAEIGSYGVSLLNMAIRARLNQTVFKLISRGVDVNKPEKSTGLNALQQAILNLELYQYEWIVLIQRGSGDVNVKDENDQTLLHFAVQAKNWNAIQVLIFKIKTEFTTVRIKIDSLNKFGQSPLLLACLDSDPNVEIVKLLINAGAKADLSFEKRFSPLEYVTLKTQNREDLLDALLESEPQIEERLILLARECWKESYARILEDYVLKMAEKGKTDKLVKSGVLSFLGF